MSGTISADGSSIEGHTSLSSALVSYLSESVSFEGKLSSALPRRINIWPDEVSKKLTKACFENDTGSER